MNRNTALMSRRKKLPVALSIVATIFIQSPSYPILVTFRGLRLRGLGLHRVFKGLGADELRPKTWTAK